MQLEQVMGQTLTSCGIQQAMTKHSDWLQIWVGKRRKEEGKGAVEGRAHRPSAGRKMGCSALG